ncbi:thioredoxin family protein [Schlesneria paludicola]|uniref:thioredoxin family protein n=1 Tax=Schlesneria paludicola TaxID=360056 RepID=UPI00029B204B|nr:thioredoxin family protein [Schlesneria paludicola]
MSKSYPVPGLGLLFVIGLSLLIASCAPSPAFPSPPKEQKRCVVLVGATWCVPCNTVKDNVVPELVKLGLSVADANKRSAVDIHLADYDHDQGILKEWGITADQVPMLVAFESGKQVDQRCGSLGVNDFLALLGRTDLGKPAKPVDPPKPIVPAEPVATIVKPDEAVPAATSTWDQITEFIGTDTATVTITVPNGRKIKIPDARAVVTFPLTLTAHVKVVGDSLQIDFDKPLLKAEATRLGIRLGTEIPSANLTKDRFTAQTALGLPFIWQLKTHPFGCDEIEGSNSSCY